VRFRPAEPVEWVIRWCGRFATWRELTFAIVPDVVGSTAATATSRLTSAGFGVRRRIRVTCDEAPGHVARQNPTGGTSAPLGSTVFIYIAVKPKICQ
jgi:beta-lactam-binding protein with PASTA domain